ncbi:MAG: Na+/H+ antiporter [Thermoleophilia bacterium]
MEPALIVLGLVVTVGVVAGLCRRLDLSAPLLLVVVGVAGSFIPGIPDIELDPDLVLIGLLPPLLYAAAIRTSLVDFRANLYPILLLSVGAVVVTTLAVGAVAWWVTPGLTVAAALALGAVVAPPDAVAATAIARKVGMPRPLVGILEGESLVNDATALVALTVAGTAITESVSAGGIGLEFVRAAGGGLAIGLVAATVLSMVRRRIEDPVLDTLLSFTAPYVAFLPAEAVHSSGVLAVVTTGLVLGHKAPVLQSAASRIAENTNWRTVQFLLENVVFLLIGLQMRSLVEAVGDAHLSAWRVTGVCAAVLAATIAVRAVYVFGSQIAHLVGTPRMRRRAWSSAGSAVVSWAGMRGVVTLAAAFVLPTETPHRDLLHLAAFVVVAGTLLIQGTTLPWLVRRLGLTAPNVAEDALQAAAVLDEASRAGLDRLEQVRTPDDPPEVIEELRGRARRRPDALWERLGRSADELEPPSATYRRLRLEMIRAERERVLQRRRTGTVDDEVLRAVLAMIDMEESLLDRIEDATTRIDDADLVSPERGAGDCEHLRDAPAAATPRTPGACEECLRDGTRWVHLRMCLTCGHVGCCDSSVGRHATGHFHETGHPVMRSVEPGEAWRWCYVDRHLG